MTADWTTEARADALAAAFNTAAFGQEATTFTQIVDAVLAALAPHVQPRTTDWEWGVRDPRHNTDDSPIRITGDMTKKRYEKLTRSGGQVVRRHRAGKWEVAP